MSGTVRDRDSAHRTGAMTRPSVAARGALERTNFPLRQ
jgi:hypothetical protein